VFPQCSLAESSVKEDARERLGEFEQVVGRRAYAAVVEWSERLRLRSAAPELDGRSGRTAVDLDSRRRASAD
jgi:hypothetical protein